MPSYAKLTMLDAQDPRPYALGKKKEAPRVLTKGEVEEERKRVRQTLFEQFSEDPQEPVAPREPFSIALEKACEALERRIKSARATAAPCKPPYVNYAYITTGVADTLGHALGRLIEDCRLTKVEREVRLNCAYAEGIYIYSDARKNPTATLEAMYKILGTRAAVAQHEPLADYPRGTRFEIAGNKTSHRPALDFAYLAGNFK